MQVHGASEIQGKLIRLALALTNDNMARLWPEMLQREKERAGRKDHAVLLIMRLLGGGPTASDLQASAMLGANSLEAGRPVEHEATVALAPLSILADFPVDGAQMAADLAQMRPHTHLVGLIMLTVNLEDAYPFVFRADSSGRLIQS
jgi:hypothetical protein